MVEDDPEQKYGSAPASSGQYPHDGVEQHLHHVARTQKKSASSVLYAFVSYPITINVRQLLRNPRSCEGVHCHFIILRSSIIIAKLLEPISPLMTSSCSSWKISVGCKLELKQSMIRSESYFSMHVFN